MALDIKDFSGIGQTISSVKDFADSIMDRFWPKAASPEEKLRVTAELEKMLSQREATIVTAQKEIIVAELQQGDDYTKRARPSIVYAGLFFIFLVHVLFPILTFYTSEKTPQLVLPEEFWWAWTSVCSVYAVGRSAEKSGKKSKYLSWITGNK